jgi:hypothetical protein
MAEYRMSTDPVGQNTQRPGTAAVAHAGGESTVALVDGAVVSVLRLDAHGNVLSRVQVDTTPVPGELTTSMGTTATCATPLPGVAQLRAAARSVTLVVRTCADDVLVCRLAYSPDHGYRVLRRTRIRH